MADNRFLARSAQPDLASFQPQLQSALLGRAQQTALRPIIVRAAQQALAIQMTMQNGLHADQAFDQFFTQAAFSMNTVIRTMCQSAGFAPDDPAVTDMCAQATDALAHDYVQFKRDVVSGVAQRIVAITSMDLQEAEPNRENRVWEMVKIFSYKFVHEW